MVQSFSLTFGCFVFATGEDDGFELSMDQKDLQGLVKYNMRKSLDLEQEGCYLQTGKKGCLEECGFNATAKTIFIIHGWTVQNLRRVVSPLKAERKIFLIIEY